MGVGLSISGEGAYTGPVTPEGTVEQTLPIAANVANLNIRLNNGTIHGILTFTLRKNEADTAVTCTIDTAPGTCSDTAHTVSYTAGETIDVQVTSNSQTTTQIQATWTATLTPS